MNLFIDCIISNGKHRIYLNIFIDFFFLSSCFFRKKLSLQLVPYIPVHPAQLKSNIKTSDEKKSLSTRPNQADDHVFKKPSPPTPYIVEEPSDINHKRSLRMKRFQRLI